MRSSLGRLMVNCILTSLSTARRKDMLIASELRMCLYIIRHLLVVKICNLTRTLNDIGMVSCIYSLIIVRILLLVVIINKSVPKGWRKGHLTIFFYRGVLSFTLTILQLLITISFVSIQHFDDTPLLRVVRKLVLTIGRIFSEYDIVLLLCSLILSLPLRLFLLHNWLNLTASDSLLPYPFHCKLLITILFWEITVMDIERQRSLKFLFSIIMSSFK